MNILNWRRVWPRRARSPSTGVSLAIASCDLMVQPYPDGVTSRRGSMMAVLAHARPIVTTRDRYGAAVAAERGGRAGAARRLRGVRIHGPRTERRPRSTAPLRDRRRVLVREPLRSASYIEALRALASAYAHSDRHPQCAHGRRRRNLSRYRHSVAEADMGHEIALFSRYPPAHSKSPRSDPRRMCRHGRRPRSVRRVRWTPSGDWWPDAIYSHGLSNPEFEARR